MLDKMGFKYQAIDATVNTDMAKTLGVKMTPTLVVDGGNNTQKLIENASNIRKYIENK